MRSNGITLTWWHHVSNSHVKETVPCGTISLHPCVIDTVTPLLDGRNRKDDTHIFALEYFDKWARKKKIPLIYRGYFVCDDLGNLQNNCVILFNGISQTAHTSWRTAFQPFHRAIIDIRYQRTYMTSIWSTGEASTSWSDFISGFITAKTY